MNLGKKNLWWKVRVIMWAPFWYLSVMPNKKSWAEFKAGLIKHKCQFNGDTFRQSGIDFRHCSHFGCTIVEPLEF